MDEVRCPKRSKTEPSEDARAVAGIDENASSVNPVEGVCNDLDAKEQEARDYMVQFVKNRIQSGHSITQVLTEFQVPADLWDGDSPQSNPRPTTVIETAKLIYIWMSTPDSDSSEGVTQPESNNDMAPGPCVASVRQFTAASNEIGKESIQAFASVKTKSECDCTWQPDASELKVVLNVEMDSATVPCSATATAKESERMDRSHVVVLDHLFGHKEQQELLNALTLNTEWDDTQGPSPKMWDKCTCDGEGMVATWGLQKHFLQKLRESEVDAVVEIQTRLQRLYPEYTIAHIPAKSVGGTNRYVADPFVGNAAVHGETYQWHIDADPSLLPGYGYVNREAGKPYFVTLLIYVNDGWPRHWDAETLFLDLDSETGVFVRPGRFRAILMDQDVTHRVSAPSEAANGRPRYSLVWKLLFIPKDKTQVCSIARPEWGAPMRFSIKNHPQSTKPQQQQQQQQQEQQ